VNAESAFISIAFRINKSCIVGAGRNARFTADALAMGDKDHSSGVVNMAGARWAAMDTRRI